jgi:dTDP-4-amino-4,6-dideoxygalactose transaminase
LKSPSGPSARVRDQFLAFALPDVDEHEIDAVAETIRSGWITTGAKAHQFETDFAAYVGAKHAVAVNSCTAAMHLALESAGLRAGDEVITTPYTFAATGEVIRYFDAKPVLVDVDPKYLNIDPSKIEQAITPRTRAIIPVHLAGYPAEMDAIMEVARRRSLWVIEDAAHSLPTAYKGRNIGTIGDATCFSFYATKTLTTGEGGMICTDRDDVADRCRIMSLHGISRDAWKRYTAEGSWFYEVIAPGFKYNLTDVAAAMGLVQLAKVQRMNTRRAAIAARFTEAFASAPQLQPPPAGEPGNTHAWHLYMLRLHLGGLNIDRAQFVEELKERKIGVSVHFIPLHVHPYYRETFGYQPNDFPVAHREYLREISLPIYSKMSDADVQDVIDAVLDVAATHRR